MRTPSFTPAIGVAPHMEPAHLVAARYRLLFENNPLPMWAYDTETLGFIAVNDAAVSSYGYTREEFLAMTIRDVRPPEDVEVLERVLQELPAGYMKTGSWQHRRKDGATFPVEITSHSMILDGRQARLVLITDITERRAAEEALRASEERFRSIVENSPLGLFRVDREGRFVLVNSALAHILGYELPAQVLGTAASSVCVDLEEGRRIGAAVSAGGTVGTEMEWCRRDGSKITVRLTVHAVPSTSGTSMDYEGFVEDVTPLRRAESALRQSEKLAAIGQLVSGVAHELNNPLSAILLFVETLLQDVRSAEDTEALTIVRDQARRSRAIVRDLLSTARAGAGRRVRISPPELLDRTLRGLAPRVEELGAELECALDGDMIEIEVDPAGIAQVVTNLIVNAAQSAGTGGKVWLRTRLCGDSVELIVEDSGAGIPPDVMPRLFEPFFTTKPHGEGTGLGLAVSRAIVESHQGFMSAENLAGGGARFVVSLPIAITNADAVVADAAEGRRMLVIDDEPSIRLALARFFTKRGWIVDEAPDGEAGLRRLLDPGSPEYALVVSDLKMPGLSGIDLHDTLERTHPALLQRVIFSTGDASSPDARAFIARSRCLMLQKPFELATLEAVAARLADRPRS